MTQASFQGLSSEEAARRLAEFGPNALPKPAPPGVFAIVLRTLREPMFALLAAAAVLYLGVGDLGEGLFMVAGAAAAISLVVFQEFRTERALEALHEMAEPMAHCLRGGVETRIPARDLVPGDIVLVSEGERLPADAVLLGGDALVVDESALTGESVAVTKILGAAGAGADLPQPGGDNTPFLYSGTMIARGSGVAEVARTGERTAIGKIGVALATIDPEPSPLQKTTGDLIAKLGVIALAFCALVIVVYGMVHGDWFQGAIAGITLAIGLLPEEFPMVLAIFLALGAWRLARRNVLVRRSSATETLGSASVLCVDKTGTLTQNRMQVVALVADGEITSATIRGAERHCEEQIAKSGIPDFEKCDEAIPEPPVTPGLLPPGLDPGVARNDGGHQTLVRAALRASSPNPVDPMDRAVHALSQSMGVAAEGAPVESFPIRPERLAFIQSLRTDGGLVYAAKGAPEAIFELSQASEDERRSAAVVIDELACRGLSVLAAAEAPVPQERATLEDAAFVFKGLLAFEDPIREEVPESVAAARRAGVAVAMITGDYPATALEIARQAGIDARGGALTGDAVAALDAAALRERLRDVRVFARVTPAAKLAIVEAFKADGHIVAMTGDGVNDGPALAAAHIGVAMGQRGTDVAREASAIVLLDDSFASIVSGIRLGRRIFANLRKALTYVMAIHVPIAGLALFPIVMGLPPLLLPAHVVLMELVIDPTCALVFEAEPAEPDAMSKPPRRRDESLFGGPQILLGVAQGAVVLLVVMAVYIIELGVGSSEPQARGLAFATVIIGNLTLAIGDALPRGVSPFARENLVFWIIATAATATVLLGLYVPFLAELLRFEAPPAQLDLSLAALLAAVAGSWYGVWRRLLDP